MQSTLDVRTAALFTFAFALAPLGGCNKSSPPSPSDNTQASASAASQSAGGNITLNGAGSSFIYPILSKWSADYQKLFPTIQINYQSVGSGAGIRQLIAHTVQFGATDSPMTDDQIKEAGAPVLHIPLVMGAIVPTYNLPEMAHAIRFTPDALTHIFLGDIKTWNDPKIASANADLKLPATPIVVVHRSDGSGSTFIWADYLSKVSPDWKTKVGASTSLNWPVGIGGKGNEGVSGTVRQTPGAIGYVELTYALQNKLPLGEMKNQAGSFIAPTIESVTAAAAGALSTIPDDLRYSITNSPGDKAWPASGTTWGLVYANMPAGPERKAVVAFLRWALHDGQKACAPLSYAPLPEELVKKAEAKLDQLEPAK
jgi:phosphate transport system substrate-binding protein